MSKLRVAGPLESLVNDYGMKTVIDGLIYICETHFANEVIESGACDSALNWKAAAEELESIKPVFEVINK